jgi:hypothetical protein
LDSKGIDEVEALLTKITNIWPPQKESKEEMNS